MIKVTYVSIGDPLKFRQFEKYRSPMGWFRLDILKTNIENVPNYRRKFTSKEIKLINSKE